MRYVVLGLALVLAAGFATAARAQDEDPDRYRLATAVLGDVQQTLSLGGTVQHTNSSDLSFAGSGTLAKVYVDEGEQVKAGQRIAALETDALEAAVTEAEARLAQAKAQLEADEEAQDVVAPRNDSAAALARALAAIMKQQKACGIPGPKCSKAIMKVMEAQRRAQQALAQPSTPSVSAPSDATIAEDEAAVDQAESDLLAAEQELEGAVLRAPRAGTVAALPVKMGATIEPGTAVATVVGKGTTTVSTSATVEKVKKLAVGQPVTVTVPGVEPLTGTISAIALLPTSGSDETTYPVTITLAGGDDLPTGSTATAAVVVATADDVVTVPASAVSDGSVQVLKEGKPVRWKVTVGAVGATTIEVSGIEAGTRVVLADREAELPSQQSTGPGGLGGLGGGPRMELRGPAVARVG